ncbi:MAG: acylphosphatase [Candidatus Levybacteria bacterium RIFCSPHIGHO2_02_FULL_37_10]|nr:MAG: acylphosphatase [Candidatus Levybacteria bacterium RIFCSPHIGHO2_02_FULL_37_10]
MKAHVVISGFVQGVGYRHFIRSNAQKLGLTGWVANVPDGKVEVLFQGPKEKIEEVILLCRKGPFLAEVEDVDVEWEEIEESFSDFKIIS